MEETTEALHVALVEDDPRLQQLISAEIVDEGHECLCFSSSEAFLDVVNHHRFHLVLLDLMLPGMDGLECLRELFSHRKSSDLPRVVIVTALNDAEKRREALSIGAEDYVLKPDLFERLPLLLTQRRA